jgi:hypothetical protein
MIQSLISTDNTVSYSTKEAGPIIVALGFVIAVGGLGIAAVIMCGWGKVKSAGINWSRRTAEIVCK